MILVDEHAARLAAHDETKRTGKPHGVRACAYGYEVIALDYVAEDRRKAG